MSHSIVLLLYCEPQYNKLLFILWLIGGLSIQWSRAVARISVGGGVAFSIPLTALHFLSPPLPFVPLLPGGPLPLYQLGGLGSAVSILGAQKRIWWQQFHIFVMQCN